MKKIEISQLWFVVGVIAMVVGLVIAYSYGYHDGLSKEFAGEFSQVSAQPCDDKHPCAGLNLEKMINVAVKNGTLKLPQQPK